MMLRVPCIVSALCSCIVWGEALFTVEGLVSVEQLRCYFSKVVSAFLSVKLGK